MNKKVVTFGEIMLRLAPNGYLRFTLLCRLLDDNLSSPKSGLQILSVLSVLMDAQKVEAVVNLAYPHMLQRASKILTLCQCYRLYIRDFSSNAALEQD